ncbi:MAG: inositol monophosphatase [Desulfobacterales bacterium]|nr:MAG: inositol monophosphatase [Desulfobacterales bacterium]
MDLEHLKRVALAAALRGAEILRSRFGRILQVDKKGATDLVTEADTASERAIITTIRTAFPDHAILAEESGMNAGTADYQWFIDPLDGTTNFAHGVSIFAISIALAIQEKPVLGIVLSPMTGELFSARAGLGAERNGRAIRVSNTTRVSESLLGTGFPYNLRAHPHRIVTRFERCLQAAQGVRRLGSAALDLCYVACGKFDGYWEEDLKPWDTAAGALIVAESGGLVTTFADQPFSVDQKEVLATNGEIHQEMFTLLAL